MIYSNTHTHHGQALLRWLEAPLTLTRLGRLVWHCMVLSGIVWYCCRLSVIIDFNACLKVIQSFSQIYIWACTMIFLRKCTSLCTHYQPLWPDLLLISIAVVLRRDVSLLPQRSRWPKLRCHSGSVCGVECFRKIPYRYNVLWHMYCVMLVYFSAFWDTS